MPDLNKPVGKPAQAPKFNPNLSGNNLAQGVGSSANPQRSMQRSDSNDSLGSNGSRDAGAEGDTERGLSSDSDHDLSDSELATRATLEAELESPENRTYYTSSKGKKPVAKDVVSREIAEIDSDMEYDDVVKKLEWTKFGGVGISINKAETAHLKAVLGNSDKFEGIVDTLSSGDEGSRSDSKSGFDTDPDERARRNQKAMSDEEDLNKGEKETKRRLAAQEFNWEAFPEKTKDYVKIGVHETNVDNVDKLVEKGPNPDLFGTANGSGKGDGFYVTPVGKKTLASATSAITYGKAFTAVYVPKTFAPVQSLNASQDHVNTLKAYPGDKLNRYYVMSGGGEIIVPEQCLKSVKVLSKLDQLDKLGEP